ncbi:hypothetical protein UAJ10_04310 [Nitrospirillum sp. BR 11164]|uniref:hypothetical protein n=1 Tax=Nitrospirillum sp. BR 11164 TaxID=3104324 RepID=UPI002AFE1CE6|nr:hypothetical protein [Nitrospirillum sp. BR 11164]MEA1648238.1 hypothetical protein [Nitrospirillum sp. BR 11164]
MSRTPEVHVPETRDMSPRAVLWSAAGLVAFVAVALGLVAGLVHLLGHGRGPTPVTAPPPMAGGAPLDEVPYLGGAQVRARAEAELTRYGWADRDAGRAIIPIDRAMDLLARKGWPDPDDRNGDDRNAGGPE